MPSQQHSAALASGSERDVWLTLPNVLTAVRLLSIVPFFFLAMYGRDREALVLFFLAGLTDTLDGAIARRLGQSSKLGRLLDPLADKIFTGVAFVALAAFRPHNSSIPLWVMLAVILRDVLILLGSFLVFRVSRNTGFKPSAYGKLNTFLEIGVVVLFLAQSDFTVLTAFLPYAYVLLLISILVSAGDYLRAGLRMIKTPRM
jgi:cardiolipin synthase